MTTASDTKPPTLRECLDACLANQEFMREYRRLSGHALGADMRSGLDRMIDAATGHEPATIDEAEARQLFEFIRDYVWTPVLAQCLGNAP